MKNYLLLILLLSQVMFSQVTSSSFDKGLIDGWNETIKEANNIDVFKAGSPDSNKCSMIPNYAPNDNKKESKEYSRGYRCGVEQATKIIPILQNQMQTKLKNQMSNSEFYVVENNKFTSLEEEMSELNRKMLQESEKYNNLPDSQRSAQLSKLNADYTNIENKLRQKYSGYQQNLEQSNYNNNQNQVQSANNNLMSLYENQKQAQINFNNSMIQQSNSLMSNAFNDLQIQAAKANQLEIERRQLVANNFINSNNLTLNEVIKYYNQINSNNFNITLNGGYSGFLIRSKSYSFLNNEKATAVTPCLVNVESDKVKNIYLYGNIEMDFLTLYKNNDYKLKNGKVDFDSNTAIVILEPYYTNNVNAVYNAIVDKVGYISIWSNDKNDAGKIVFIQEIDNKGNIVREISADIKYYKNEKSINYDEITKIPMNINNRLLFFGVPTPTPIGVFPLYPKISKESNEPLKSNEYRLIEIKKYRQ